MIVMMVESELSPKISWKDKLLGINPGAIDKEELGSHSADADDDLEFIEGDIYRSIVNGIPAIDFLERIQQILFKEMELTVVVELLGRNIGFGALNNRISSLWKPSKPFHLRDIENGYYLAKFQSSDDYTKVLTQGPWLIYGQYLTVQPWTKEFSTSQPYPSTVLAWIRLPGLPGFLYKKKIIEVIGSTIGKVVRLDFNTDSRSRGQFAMMAVYINLDKPLIVRVLMNGRTQRVEYEALPTICFSYGKYDHTKEFCASLQPEDGSEKDPVSATPLEARKEGESTVYGPWMVVERKNRRNTWNNIPIRTDIKGKGKSGSRFGALVNMEGLEDLEREHNKGDEGTMADFQGSLKAGEFVEEQRNNSRDSPNFKKNMWMGRNNLGDGSFNLSSADTVDNGLVDPPSDVGVSGFGSENPSGGKRISDPNLSNLFQAINGVGPNCTDARLRPTGPGSSSKASSVAGSNVKVDTALKSRPTLSVLKPIEVQDLGFIGPSFTWQRGNTQERLDRAFANDA
ncbi:hypothetical protein CXB51_019644 [Gossypium anomalum]|uniref:DUF4283 domain-containing protein n=1 Tax=Gossypium anomalum TaxID=47600 RepID=A0A8J5YP78_9ROSI|nr:hypothetical protein CXB51_019644 [Gossypium anomalum]